jgi:DNA polymerase-3 subunit delta'
VSFSRVRGQPVAVERLRAALGAGRLAHAYLLTGPAGVGKRTLARELIRAVLCERLNDDACDQCRSCRAVESGNSLELSVLHVEEAGGRFRPVADSDRELKVGSIRALERELALKAAGGRCRAVLIPGAERMNEEAQNALLKTLEEPRGSRLMVLTSGRSEALLPTVISRLARVRLRPLSAEEIAAHLVAAKGMQPAEAGELAAAAEGSIGAALSADLEQVRAVRDFARRRLAAASSGEGPLEVADRILEFARARAGSGRGLEALRVELLALISAAAKECRARLVGVLSSDQDSGPACARIESLLRAGETLRGNANPQLVCRVLAGELAGN